VIGRAWESIRTRLVASDPGYLRLRLALSAVLAIGIAIAVLVPLGHPLTIVLVGAIAAMNSTFTVNDDTRGKQAVTLVLALFTSGISLTAASIGAAVPPVDSIVFVLLIFVAVYSQRFGPRGTALGSISFFLFFFAMFLQTHIGQTPELIFALAVGLGSNALVRFVLLPRRADRELLRIRRAFRARLGAVVRAAEGYLDSGGSSRSSIQLRRANERLHESVLMIEDTADDVLDETAASRLRRRAVEVELAVQWLAVITRRICGSGLDTATRDDLIRRLRRFRALIERDPRDLPVISETGEFSRMLVEGSKLGERAEPGDELRRAIAELALADVNAQRIAEHDYTAETDCGPGDTAKGDAGKGDDGKDGTGKDADEPDDDRTRVFAFDNQTRSALQAVVGGGLAVLGGQLVSPQRWYWAVLTVFVVFIGSSTAGATFVKGVRRSAGTLLGIIGGVLATLLVAGDTPGTIALILVCVFSMVYTARVSQALMAFFITTMLGLLYSLLGTFSYEVLWVRVAETAIGAAAGILAAVVIVPVRTRAVMLDDVRSVLEDLREFLTQARELLLGTRNINIVELSRDLDRSVERVRATVEPLTHPINLRSSRRDYGWYVLTTLESVAFRVRHIGARAEPGLFATDDRLPEHVERIVRHVDTLLEATDPHGRAQPRTLVRDGGSSHAHDDDVPRRRSVLASLDQLDAAVIALGTAFDVTAEDVTQSVKSDDDQDHGPGREATHPSEVRPGG
jgi:uncharacterized membrane protein YccC